MIASPISSKDDSFEVPALMAEDAVLFPEMEVSMVLRDSKNITAASQAFKERKLAVLIPVPGPEGAVGTIGTLVLLRGMSPVTAGGTSLVSKGLWRVRIKEVRDEKSYTRVRFTKAGETEDVASGRTDTMKTVFGQIDQFETLMPGIPSEIIAFLKAIDSPGKLADMCAYSPFFTLEEKLDLLRTLDAEKRLAKVSKLFDNQLAQLRSAPQTTSITECPTCNDLADKAFEMGAARGREVAREFLAHVVKAHSDELLAVLAEEYGPAFLRKRALR